MGEDFPLDPNHVQPPSEEQSDQHLEGEAHQIEVTSHTGTEHSDRDEVYDEDESDPLEGDVDRFVDPRETRSDAEIEHDERIENQAHMSGADDSDSYWDEYDEIHRELPKPPAAEDIYEFGEQDIADRNDARQWLKDSIAYYTEEAQPFMKTDSDGEQHVKHVPLTHDYERDKKAGELNRLLEPKYWTYQQTSNTSPVKALETIDTGYFHTKNKADVGNLDASEDLRDKFEDIHDFHDGGPKQRQLSIEDLRIFTGKFADLQRKRKETIANSGFDPLKNQLEDVFITGDTLTGDRWDRQKAETLAYTNTGIQLFEELYDSNPEKFAEMPTKDFVNIVREINTLSNNISLVTIQRNSLQRANAMLAELTNKHRPLKPSDTFAIRGTIERGLESGSLAVGDKVQELEEFNQRVREINRSAFDVSPRQRIAEYNNLVTEYEKVATTKIATLQGDRQQILDSHKSQPAEVA